MIRLAAIFCSLRVFSPSEAARWQLRGWTILSILLQTALVLDVCLICHPIKAAWDTSVKGRCGNQVLSFVLLESIGLFIDLGIIYTPISTIWSMRMSYTGKIVAVCVFSTGSLYVLYA